MSGVRTIGLAWAAAAAVALGGPQAPAAAAPRPSEPLTSQLVSKRGTAVSAPTSQALPGGGAVLAWVSSRPSAPDKRIQVRIAHAGGGLSPILTVARVSRSRGGFSRARLALAVAGDGTVALMWTLESEAAVHVALLRDKVIADEVVVPLSEGARPGSPGICATEGGDFDLFWVNGIQIDPFGLWRLNHVRLDADGNVGPSERVAGAGLISSVATAPSGPDCTVVWSELGEDSATESVRSASVTAAGATGPVSTLETIADATQASLGSVAAASSGGSVFAAWGRYSSESPAIRAAVITAGSPAPTTTVSESESDYVTRPAVTAFGPDGAAVAWERSRPGRHSPHFRIEARTWAASGELGPLAPISAFGTAHAPRLAGHDPSLVTWIDDDAEIHLARWDGDEVTRSRGGFGPGKNLRLVADARGRVAFLTWVQHLERAQGVLRLATVNGRR